MPYEDDALFFDLLKVIGELLDGVNGIKFKLDELIVAKPGRAWQLSSSVSANFMKELVSRLAIVTKKLVDTVPELRALSSKANPLLLDFFQQQAFSLKDLVFYFAEGVQKQQGLVAKCLSEENIMRTSVELDALVSHMSQTARLLGERASSCHESMVKILHISNLCIQYMDNLVDSVLQAQDAEKMEQVAEDLKNLAKNEFPQIIVEIKQLTESKRWKDSLGCEILEDMNNIVTFMLAEISVIAKNFTHDPVYSEEQAQTISNQSRKDLFLVLCEIQCFMIGYSRKLKRKCEMVELDPTRKSLSLPHMESTSVAIALTPQKLQESISARKPVKTKKRRGVLRKIRNRSTSDDKAIEVVEEEQESPYVLSLPESINVSPLCVTEKDTCPPPKESKHLSATRFASANEISDTEREDEVKRNFHAKRPKISRNVSKTRLFNIEKIDTPERILTKSILDILNDELPWFKEKWLEEHSTAIYRINTKFEETIKKDLVSYGNKVRGVSNLNTARVSLLSTPRGSTTDFRRTTNLQQLVSSDTESKDKWRGLLESTSVSLTPLEVPRLRAAVNPLNHTVNELIAASFSIVAKPHKRELQNTLRNAVQEYYEKLRLIVNICAGTPDKQALLTFLEKSLEDLILEAPAFGKVDQKLISTKGEEYKLQLTSAKVRRYAQHTAAAFRALVIQMGSTINNIPPDNTQIEESLLIQMVSNIVSQLDQIKIFLDVVATSQEFSLSIKEGDAIRGSRGPPPQQNRVVHTISSSNRLNIYKRETIPNHPKFYLGDLNSFVMKLTETEEEVDNHFMKAFLATYQSFTTPLQLFLKLVERYRVPPIIDPEIAKKVRLRVVVVLKYWIQTQYYDINHYLVTKINKFLLTLKDGGQTAGAAQLENLLEAKESERRAAIQRFEIADLPPLDVNAQKSSGERISPSDIVFTATALDIAKHLTMHEASIFHDIELSELLNQAWSKDSARYHSPNVTRFITSVNQVSYWVATAILWYSDVSLRTKVIVKFIAIAKHLHQFGNFNSLMGIISGLTIGCISRLKCSFKGVSEKQLNLLNNFKKILMPCNDLSHKIYREQLANAPLPRLPYLGVFLGQLARICDGNPSEIIGYINFDKHHMVYEVMELILISQQQNYDFELCEPLQTFFAQLPSLREEELWSLSMQREPVTPGKISNK